MFGGILLFSWNLNRVGLDLDYREHDRSKNEKIKVVWDKENMGMCVEC